MLFQQPARSVRQKRVLDDVPVSVRRAFDVQRDARATALPFTPLSPPRQTQRIEMIEFPMPPPHQVFLTRKAREG